MQFEQIEAAVECRLVQSSLKLAVRRGERIDAELFFAEWSKIIQGETIHSYFEI